MEYLLWEYWKAWCVLLSMWSQDQLNMMIFDMCSVWMRFVFSDSDCHFAFRRKLASTHRSTNRNHACSSFQRCCIETIIFGLLRALFIELPLLSLGLSRCLRIFRFSCFITLSEFCLHDVDPRFEAAFRTFQLALRLHHRIIAFTSFSHRRDLWHKKRVEICETWQLSIE